MTPADPEPALVALLASVARRQREGELALRALYDLTAGKLFGLALRVTGRRDWAEDVLQEAFITIWRSAGDYEGTLSPPLA